MRKKSVAGAPREMEVPEFLRRLKLDEGRLNRRFAFFLGAGCSVSSGISAAADLVRDRWLPRLKDIHEWSDVDQGAVGRYDGYTGDKAAAFYGAVLDDLFVTADERQQEIESLCDGRSPGFGYAILAQLVARPDGRFNVVLTTNFDDLMADALYLYTDTRPLVIQHESLAAFIRPTRTRPLVVKLHGDHRLSPRNTALETVELEREIAAHTAMVLNDRGLIFMGYGGNDGSILRLLEGLPREAIPAGAYWVHPHRPSGPLGEWLAKRGGVWVKSGWFDEVMLLARNTFELPHPQPDRFTRIFDEYQTAFRTLSSRIEARPVTDAGVARLKEVVQETERSLPEYWKIVSEARRLEKTDPAEAERTYRAGIERFPGEVALLVNYATLLEDTPGRAKDAEAYYQRALKNDPKNATVLGYYADYLQKMTGRSSEVEDLYKRAIAANPRSVTNLRYYAEFLEEDPSRRDEAESFYKQALEVNPGDATTLGDYASFLEETTGRREEADAYYRRAVSTDPPNATILANYADYLHKTTGREREAESFYKRALELEPENSFALRGYADLLERVLGDKRQAVELRQRADAVNT